MRPIETLTLATVILLGTGVASARPAPRVKPSRPNIVLFVEIAGGDPSKIRDLDGVSLVPTIKENGLLGRGEPIYGYRAYEDLYASVRLGDWKLLAYRSGTVKLYNITKDMKEKHDVAQAHPDEVKELREQLVKWENAMGVENYSGVQ
jgi:hypothetical protein